MQTMNFGTLATKPMQLGAPKKNPGAPGARKLKMPEGPQNQGPDNMPGMWGHFTGDPRRGGPTNNGPMGVPAQNAIGAKPPQMAAPQQGTGIYSQAAGGNAMGLFNSMFAPAGNAQSGGQGGGGATPQGAAMQYLGGGAAISTRNPTTPGSWAIGGTGGPSQTGQLGAWQNNQNIQQTAQAFGGRGGNYSNDGSAPLTGGGQNAFNSAMQYLGGGGAISTSNPVTPGSWWNGGIGSPTAAGALGAWQNNQNLAQTMQAFGYRGPDMAMRDAQPAPADLYRRDDNRPEAQQYWAQRDAQQQPPAGGGGSGGSPAPGGVGAPQGQLNPVTGGGQPGIAPIYSTIDGNRPIFDDGQIQRNVNQEVEAIRTKNGSQRSNMKKFQRPGMSMDAGTAAAAAPLTGQALADALAVQQGGPLQDQLANSTYQLSGQQGRGDEVLAMADILRRLQSTGDYEQTSNASLMGSLTGSLMQLLMGN